MELLAYERDREKSDRTGFLLLRSARYSELPRYYRESQNKPDVAVFQVSPWTSTVSSTSDRTHPIWLLSARPPKVVIVEVNENMPVCLGGFEEGVHISNVDMIVEGDNPAIAEMGGAAAASDVDEAVAKPILEEIPDGACFTARYRRNAERSWCSDREIRLKGSRCSHRDVR